MSRVANSQEQNRWGQRTAVDLVHEWQFSVEKVVTEKLQKITVLLQNI